jgi:hypothetical protein
MNYRFERNVWKVVQKSNILIVIEFMIDKANINILLIFEAVEIINKWFGQNLPMCN